MAAKRSIFEDVDGVKQPPAPQGGMISGKGEGARRAIRAWLWVLFVMVAAIIVVGGLTRLTGSGLSITEWRPILGALPPMGEAQWLAEFAKYKEIPQYELVNKGMTLEAFQAIYWWEWGHRQLGRAVGLVWAVGFLGFWLTGKIPTGWTGRLLLIGVLGGLQGAIGWWMVSSGLSGEMVRVASYRLAVHLGLAFVILGFIAWYAMLLSRSESALLQARRGREAKLFSMSTGMMHFCFLQLLLGALVAGINAGTAFPTWPDMNGEFFPSNAFYVPDGGATWRAFFENEGLVQFMHRMAAYGLAIFGLVTFIKSRRSVYSATRTAFLAMFCVLFLQVVIGIGTALSGAHMHAAITHQLVAIVLWVAIIRARFLSQYPIAGSIRAGTQ